MLPKIFILAALAAAYIGTAHSCVKKFAVEGTEILSLNAERSTNTWTAHGINSTGTEIRVPATVPGGIYTDLEEGGILSSPVYHEYNDVENMWVGRMNWNYSRSFTVSDAIMEKPAVVLVCEGLDTISDIFINDVLVGKGQNMFVRYVYDVKSVLRSGQNSIRVAFTSPVLYAAEQYAEHIEQHGYPILPEEQLEPEFRGEPKGQMIRKMSSSFGWDWGPSYPTSGIWKDIYIEAYEVAVIRDVLIFSRSSQRIPDETAATQWTVTARVYYDAAVNASGMLRINREGLPPVSSNVDLVAGKGNSVEISITESGASTRLWWPNGYGGQFLYRYNVSLLDEATVQLSTRELQYGFRTLEVVEDLVDRQNASKGREFYFKVNGDPIYSKGSNTIPLHVLRERISRDQERWLLHSAQLTHMNFIRVWGGGVYASDDIFDYADEYGILIWQDFIFAASTYATTPSFLENIRQEVDTQVKRLQHRASLAIWSGNNENELLLRENAFGTDSRYETYYQDYVKLYIDTLKNLTEELDPSRTYIPSSPTNGIKTEEEGWIAEHPQSLNYGDIHYFVYTDDNWDWRVFPRTRYASEFGFQSYPQYDRLAGVADDISTWTWDSNQMEHRMRHPHGQAEIRDYIRNHLPFPQNYNSVEAFPHMLYMAQITQAMGVKTEAERYRRLVDKMDEDGTGHNMGAVYWNLNDIWVGGSWSSMENNGRWKMLLYYAQKFFSPIVASPYWETNGDLVVELVSDKIRTIAVAPLEVQIFKMGNMTPIYEYLGHPSAEFLQSKVVHRVRSATLAELGCAEDADSGTTEPCVVYVTFAGYPDNFLFLQYPKNKDALKDPNLQIEGVEAVDSQRVTFRLTTEAIAPFVYLTRKGCPQGYFSDNGFLQTTGTKDMEYFCEGGITPEQFIEDVEVMSLFNVTAVAGDTVSTLTGQ